MKKYIAHFSDDSLIFECNEIEEDLVYSAACHAVARHVVTDVDLLNEVLQYLCFDEDQFSDFNSLSIDQKVEDLGELLYEESNWVFVEG